MKTLIKKRKKLCCENGNLNLETIGYEKYPHIISNLKGIRKKRFNFWTVKNDIFLFSIAIVDVDYTGKGILFFYDRVRKEYFEEVIEVPFAKNFKLSEFVYGNSSMKKGEYQISNEYIRNNAILKADTKKFKVDIEVKYPENVESLNLIVPWNNKKFHFTSKQNCLPAMGRINIEGRIYSFHIKNTLASFDYGRGIWPYKTFWNWASFSGFKDGEKFGINLGYGWTKGSGVNENCVFYDNKMYKLNDEVEFIYDKLDKEVIIKSSEVDIVFKTEYIREEKTNVVVLKSNLKQAIGSFSGIIKFKNKEIEFKDIFGIIEEHKARW
ncbi:hypothetical protein OSSY52_08490 [Tepiditoga spiralis]|uniref:DUF2804 domain-containing protein n=1 Tax=Tepiditoga spiralis TaxID=2108365 RepID=A0A7G1G2X1_9BACT|nr:DUF2804 domain-containing protein [Tepiditoga spiralis]BBE30708.1 hypothetical protein OSSY52_08490 [Tepiditoga spiralis]